MCDVSHIFPLRMTSPHTSFFSEVEGNVVDQQRKGTGHLFAAHVVVYSYLTVLLLQVFSWLAKNTKDVVNHLKSLGDTCIGYLEAPQEKY